MTDHAQTMLELAERVGKELGNTRTYTMQEWAMIENALRSAVPREQKAKPVAWWHEPTLVEQRISALEKAHGLATDHKTRDALRAAIGALTSPSDSPGSGWPPQFEPMKLQARDGGDWIDIFPG